MARLLRMPEVAANTVEAVLSEWPVPENTPFTTDDVIATIETEKAVVDVPADVDGVILRTLVRAGTEVEVGAPIALLGDPGETVEDLDALLVELGVALDGAVTRLDGAQDASAATANHPDVSGAPAPTLAAGTASSSDGVGGRIFSSPLARRLSREAGLSLTNLTGTGPGGRIVRRDIQRAIEACRTSSGEPVPARQSGEASLATPAGGAAYDDVPHTRMRRAIAARLTESTRNAPHFFVHGTARVDRLLKLRASINGAAPVKVSVNDLVVMAAARAHVLVPAMNVIWTANAVRSFSAVDVSLAVATDKGLVTPVVRDVDRMTLSAVAAATGDLIGRARAGRLRQDELEGGTLTVTNLGVFGTENFSAIINPPQSAILAVGAARQEPVVSRGRLKVGTVMRVTLSVDHRPIDGAVAARWMAAFLALIEEPVRILA
jgi:pyruvate dehydrogenase E2 component (dihydrolipoamide acetyltransferase)